MPKRLGIYTRVCKRCGNLFITSRKGKVCFNCSNQIGKSKRNKIKK